MARTSPLSASPPDVDVPGYLEWIGFGGTPGVDLATLVELHELHMTAVPFENLSIALGDGVPLDAQAAVDKIVDRGRGGWCFEVNAAFAALLEAIGFDVTLLGAAVLLGGPSRVVDHLALEVAGSTHGLGPHLVDVGFGESFTRPLALNTADVQDGGEASYQLLGSPEGTTLARLDDGVPAARYRFKRVAHTLDQFASISASLQVDPDTHWHRKPFATRLLARGPDRVTLTHDRLKIVRDGVVEERPVRLDAWPDVLRDWFGIVLEPSEIARLEEHPA